MSPVAFYVAIAIALAAVFTYLAVGRRVGTITIDSTNNTLQGLANAINQAGDPAGLLVVVRLGRRCGHGGLLGMRLPGFVPRAVL